MKQKSRRRLLAGIIAFCMIISMLPMSAFAAENSGPFAEVNAGGETTQYDDLESFAAAVSGLSEATVTLLRDYELSTALEIAENQKITLNLDGKVLSVPSDFTGRPIINRGTLEITGNGTIDSSMSETGGYGAVDNYGTLTIQNGTYRGSLKAGGAAIKNRPEGQLTINGGTYEKATCALYNEGTATVNNGTFLNTSCSSCDKTNWSYTIRSLSSTAKLYFNNGTVKGVQGALGIAGGYAEVKDGTFTTESCAVHTGGSTAFYACYIAGERGEVEAHIYGGDYNAISKYALYVGNSNDGGEKLPAVAYVHGGTFVGKEGALYADSALGDPVISGGSFSSDVSAHISSDCTIAEVDGKYVVTPRSEENAVAQIDNRNYETIDAAIKAAGDGETIKLLKSTAEDVVIPKGKNVTIDLNGQTLTNAADHTIKNAGTLTIQGEGTVDNVTHAKAALYNDVGGTATLKSGNYTRSLENGQNSEDNGGNSYYAILNHGDMTIESGVSVTQNGQYSSLLENGWQNGTQNTEKVPSNLTIRGGVFSGGLNTIKNDDYGVLTIEDGNFENVAQAAVLNWNVATIKNGTFTSEQYVVLNGKLDDEMDKGELTVTGGTFVGTKDVISQMGGSNSIGTVKVSGGTFSSDPTVYLVTGKIVVKNAELYEVRDVTPVEDVDMTVQTGEPVVDSQVPLPEDFPAEKLADTAVNGITVAAGEVAENMDAATANRAKELISDKGLNPDDTVLVVEPYTEISVTGYDETNQAIVLEIELYYNLKATTNPDNMDDTNTVPVAEKQLLNSSEALEIAVPVPAGITSTGTNLYVKHEKEDGTVYYYTATVKDGLVTFTNPNGFSTFTIFADGRIGKINFQDENGTIIQTENYTPADQGKELPDFQKSGYIFKGWMIGSKTYTAVTDELLSYVDAQSDKTVAAKPVLEKKNQDGNTPGGNPDVPGSGYTVVIADTTNGTITASPRNAKQGTEVTLTATPRDGYHLESISVINRTGDEIPLVKKGNNKFVFTMPASKVRVTATFAEGTDEVVLPFVDVEADEWFYQAVQYVYTNGVMDGTSATEFLPNMQLTRAMLAQILYNLEGNPEVEDSGAFVDVKDDQWFAPAINWAASKQIVDGVGNNEFAPDRELTREEMATILFRYASYKNYSTNVRGDLSGFVDGDWTGDWARPAVEWAVGMGLIGGLDNNVLAPNGSATRAQVAKVLMVFCETVVR